MTLGGDVYVQETGTYEKTVIGDSYLRIDVCTGFARGASEGQAGTQRGYTEGPQPKAFTGLL